MILDHIKDGLGLSNSVLSMNSRKVSDGSLGYGG